MIVMLSSYVPYCPNNPTADSSKKILIITYLFLFILFSYKEYDMAVIIHIQMRRADMASI